MQVTETGREGLKRTLKVVVAKAELDERFKGRLDEIKDRVQIKGFRKGKVPMPHLKKVYGKQLMAEVLEEALKDTSQKAIKERNERPAVQPEIKIENADSGEVERVINGEADLAYSMSFEVLPPIPIADFETLEARASHRRRRPGRHRSGAQRTRRAQHIVRTGRGPRCRRRRYADAGFRRQNRRRSLRGRQRRRRQPRHRQEAVHSRIRRSAHRRQSRRAAPRQSNVPGGISDADAWPARLPSSTLR